MAEQDVGHLATSARLAALDLLVRESATGVAVLDRELRYVLVNPVLAAINGRSVEEHLGRRLDEVLAEVPAPLEGAFRAVLDHGESVHGIELEAPTPAAPELTRRFGGSFHPLCDDEGAVVAVLGLVVERTDESRALEVLRTSERRYRSLVEATTSQVWHVRPGDEPRTEWLERIHPDDRERVAAAWVDAVEQRNVFETECRLGRGEPWRHVLVRAVPIVEGGDVVEWVGASTDVTESRRARDELRTSEARLRLAVESGGMGAWDWDLVGGTISWSAETATLFGLALEEFGGTWDDFARRVHPDDLPEIQARVDAAVAEVGAFEAEMRAWRDGGWNAWILSRGQVFADATGRPVRMVGMVVDITHEREQAARVSQILERVADAFFAVDTDWRFTYVNAEAARVLQRRPEDLVGRSIWTEFPGALGTIFEESYRRALDAQEVVSFQGNYPDLGWFDVRSYPSPTGISVYFRNIDEQRAASTLRHVTAALTEVLTEQDVARVVLDIAAGALGASGGAVAVFDVHGEDLHFIRTTWPQQAQDQWSSSDLHLDRPSSRAARTGQAVFLGSPEELEIHFPRAIGLLEGLDERAVASVPLLLHGDCLGSLTLTFSDRRSFSAEERELIGALGDACAQALDRARLHDREHRVAVTLQRALLPEQLARPAGVASAARYLPGTEGLDVGGDWYDVFDLGDARLGIVLGDVVGKGIGAATVMGRLRNALRAFATSIDGPGEVLQRLDDFAGRFGNEDLATLLYGVLDVGTGELRFSAAGHLPPLVVAEDGEAGFLVQQPDVPVGVAGPSRREHRVRLPPGTTLFLYSDGLVEDRCRTLDEGMDALRRSAGTVHDDPDLEATCDRVLQELVGVGGQDDVALLAVRWLGPDATDRCSVVLPAQVASASRARALVREELERWGEDELVETATLCVSEVVTNAVVHAGTPVGLDISLHEGCVRIEVRDGGVAPPERVDAHGEDVHGRGVAIVELLSAAWGVDLLPDGKLVWFELSREATPATSGASSPRRPGGSSPR